MGRDDNLKRARSGKGATGGGKWERYAPRTVAETVHYSAVAAEALRDTIDAVVEGGDAILFARTSDGGALSITICSGQDRYKVYANSAEDTENKLAEIENQAKSSQF